MSGDFDPEQKRYLEGFVTGLQIAKATRGQAAAPGAAPAGAARAERSRCASIGGRRTRVLTAGGKLSEQEKFKRELQPARRLRPPEGAGGGQRVSQAARQFPLALLRPVLRRAEPELLHVPAADAERHPHALAIRRRRRPGGALRRRLRPCHHPRQSAGARGRGQERRRHGRGDPGPRAAARAAPAPTTSATSPARRPPASIRRS